MIERVFDLYDETAELSGLPELDRNNPDEMARLREAEEGPLFLTGMAQLEALIYAKGHHRYGADAEAARMRYALNKPGHALNKAHRFRAVIEEVAPSQERGVNTGKNYEIRLCEARQITADSLSGRGRYVTPEMAGYGLCVIRDQIESSERGLRSQEDRSMAAMIEIEDGVLKIQDVSQGLADFLDGMIAAQAEKAHAARIGSRQTSGGHSR